jgi:hypothetical protein
MHIHVSNLIVNFNLEIIISLGLYAHINM